MCGLTITNMFINICRELNNLISISSRELLTLLDNFLKNRSHPLRNEKWLCQPQHLDDNYGQYRFPQVQILQIISNN